MSLRQPTQTALKFFPALRHVALFAALTKLPIVNIRSAMARHTGVPQRGCILTLGRLLRMAALAANFAVRAVEHILGALVVIEVPQRP